ncbi:aldehyde dehydrogenase family protein [Haloarcula nitratireducens]|uniref:Aldehyde dehydrogenase family protein n=1 Tax=Haloarcula nitratireducens TaxID=2487749 RepID=A0AAW4PGQ1_9EURY|nr:aldehyde dehydrogenase family protein [Halomicroarcula nitratireducens]MBX0297083.1 aldehyde dehydrogenase family protein [Halomicroarcula nitratireducens]
MTDTQYQYIDGEWIEGDSDDEMTVRNPAVPDDPLATFPRADREQARNAVNVATEASETWEETTPDERDSLLYDVADLIDDNVDELAQTLTKEEGKAISSSRGEVSRAAEIFRFFASYARTATGETIPSSDPDTFTYTIREPLGTVALVTPWNFPIATPSWKLATALVTGNTVVFKPSSQTPMIAKRLVELLELAGIPDGVVNLVVGSGSTVGDELTMNDGIDGVSFTGSTGVGRQIAQAAADRGIPIQTEMGGKNPQVVLPDADIEDAADAAIGGAFGLTGQACTATSRLIAHEDVVDELTDAVVERAESLSIGPGMDDPDMGPAVSEEQDETNFDYIDIAKEEGATLLTGGTRPDGLESGYYIEPTVFTDVTSDMRIAQEEVFGPVLSIMEASDFDGAIKMANDVEFGLSSSVFTADMASARRFANAIEAGVVKINGTTTGSQIQMPFGGMKASSSETQKEMGQTAYEFYTHEKAVYRTDP